MPSCVTRQRRRQSDAKWRASIAECYETLKQIILIDNKGQELSKRKITKAKILTEASKHIVFLEGILETILQEQDQHSIPDDEMLSMQAIQEEFIRLHGKEPVKSSYRVQRIKRKYTKRRSPTEVESELSYNSQAGSQHDMLPDVLYSIESPTVAYPINFDEDEEDDDGLGLHCIWPTTPDLKMSNQPSIASTNPESLLLSPVHIIDNMGLDHDSFKTPKLKASGSYREPELSPFIPASPLSLIGGSPSFHSLLADQMLVLTPLKSDDQQLPCCDLPLNTPNPKLSPCPVVVPCSPIATVGFTPVKLPSSEKHHQSTEQVEERDLMCMESIETMDLDDVTDRIDTDARKSSSRSNCGCSWTHSTPYEVHDSSFATVPTFKRPAHRCPSADDAAVPELDRTVYHSEEKKPKMEALTRKPKCKKKLESFYADQSATSSESLLESKSEDNSEVLNKPECQDFDGYLLFYKHVAKDVERCVSKDSIPGLISDMWDNLPLEQRETMTAMAVLEDSNSSQESNLSEDLKDVDVSFSVKDKFDLLGTYSLDVIDDFLKTKTSDHETLSTPGCSSQPKHGTLSSIPGMSREGVPGLAAGNTDYEQSLYGEPEHTEFRKSPMLSSTCLPSTDEEYSQIVPDHSDESSSLRTTPQSMEFSPTWEDVNE